MTQMKTSAEVEAIVSRALDAAKNAGATAAEAIYGVSATDSVSVRRSAVDGIDRAESASLSLRIFKGDRAAGASTSDMSVEALENIAKKTIAIAQEMPEDPEGALAGKELLATSFQDFDTIDHQTCLSAQDMIQWSLEAEKAAHKDQRISQSYGAGFTVRNAQYGFGTTAGFFAADHWTAFSGSAGVVAQDNGQANTGYDGCIAHHFGDLKTPEEIGIKACKKAIEGLGAVQLPSASLPVLIDREAASSILGHFLAMINGDAILLGTSMLKEDMGNKIFPSSLMIIDDPHRKRGFGATSFDGEGLPTQKHLLVENGVVNSWLLDLKRARKLGLKPTAHASRGGRPCHPSSHDAYIQAGDTSPEEIMKKMGRGIFVTGFMGNAVNTITGDYSRGITGFLVENGEKTTPLKEMTLSGHLRDIFSCLTPANDLLFDAEINSPSLYIPEPLQVSGV